jgi:LacI family transcriptional regulator
VGRSPHAEILRVKLNRVKQLLVETDLSVARIARLAGFEHPEYLSVAFKREIGLRPQAFRKEHHARRPAKE